MYHNRTKSGGKNGRKEAQRQRLGRKGRFAFLLYSVLVCVLFLGAAAVMAKESGGRRSFDGGQ